MVKVGLTTQEEARDATMVKVSLTTQEEAGDATMVKVSLTTQEEARDATMVKVSLTTQEEARDATMVKVSLTTQEEAGRRSDNGEVPQQKHCRGPSYPVEARSPPLATHRGPHSTHVMSQCEVSVFL